MDERYLIETLGPAGIPSPIHLGNEPGDLLADFTPDDARVLTDISLAAALECRRRGEEPSSFELAGPRSSLFFDASRLKVGIVTCGGICPGLNNVVRDLVMTLHHGYGVRGILGFRYGFAGLNPQGGLAPLELNPTVVSEIHLRGGTILGTSRGPQPPEVMVDTLARLGIHLIFTIGGDGTFRGTLALHEEIKRRRLAIGVVAIPKTIDNDIPLVDRTFGFNTAVGLAAEAIRAGYAEATSTENGIGLVKLMGRNAGFIAAHAALAVRTANLVLVPELPFDLDGEQGLMGYLEERFERRKSTVIVVAEGAGQEHLAGHAGTDASGNRKLGDIGVFLKEQIEARLSARYRFSIKYIDPSYIIRSAAAGPDDSIFCGQLANAAAHAGMAGKTGLAVGLAHGRFTHLPLRLLVGQSKRVDPESELWLAVLESTGQPFTLKNDSEKNYARLSLPPRV